ncbi:hypothetical protein ACFQV2_06205 [Actinokineospora soli]|uniref:Uncharacterized protein n=1 Tax=Actinokineospora soli TaxID=1048753 RepID=A0ABW2TJW3_9PSEU
MATVADVQARTEVQLTAEQQARAGVLVGDASAIVRARVPGSVGPAARDRAGCDRLGGAAGAGLAAGRQQVRDGEWVLAHGRARGRGIYLTEDEPDLLRPTPPAPRGAFSIWTV